MSRPGRIWFTMFAVVGALAGVLAGGVLWLILARPVLVVQTLAGLP